MLNPLLSHSKSDKIIIVGSNVDVWERVPNLNMSMDSSNKIEERAYGEGGAAECRKECKGAPLGVFFFFFLTRSSPSWRSSA